MKKILVSGASVSAGAGLEKGKQNKFLWINRLVMDVLNVSLSDINNISEIGLDNKEIFLATAHSMINENYSDVFICWQTLPRINIHYGLELYSTRDNIIGPHAGFKHKLVAGQSVSNEKIDSFRKYFLRYYNYHWDIKDLISYLNILKSIAKTKNINLYFINFAGVWKENRYFDKKSWITPDELDPFTQETLSIDLRDDTEIRALYTLIHDHYEHAGGILSDNWINLYEPLQTFQIDVVSNLDSHPGLKSQDTFYNFLKPILTQKYFNLEKK